jgi:hypothetical protein
MDKEITNIRLTWWYTENLPSIWRVEYTAKANGRRYFKHVHAKDELEAYSIVMGLREEPKRKAEQ